MSSRSLNDQCKSIWQTVFKDSEAFTDLYFSRRYPKGNTFISRANDHTVAQAQCFTYRMTAAIDEPMLTVGYLSGLATLPQYRRQGHAANIMHQLHQWQQNKGIDYSLLIPADEEAAQWYISHFAYRPICTRAISMDAMQLTHYTPINRLTAPIAKQIQHHLSSTPYTLQHTADDLADQLAVCKMSGGGLYTDGTRLFMAELHCGTARILDSFSESQPENTTSDTTPVLYLPICKQSPLPKEIRITLMLS